MHDRTAVAVDDHRARPALAESAAKPRTLQAEIVAQDIEQRSRRVDIHGVRAAVHLQCDVAHARSSARMGWASRRSGRILPSSTNVGYPVQIGSRVPPGAASPKTKALSRTYALLSAELRLRDLCDVRLVRCSAGWCSRCGRGSSTRSLRRGGNALGQISIVGAEQKLLRVGHVHDGALGQVHVGGAALHAATDERDLVARLQGIARPAEAASQRIGSAHLGLPARDLAVRVRHVQNDDGVGVDHLQFNDGTVQRDQSFVVASCVPVMRPQRGSNRGKD